MESRSRLPIRVVSVDRRDLVLGVALVLFSFLMPIFFNVSNFDVLHSLERALRMGEKTDLMVAALQLVALNSIRSMPHYVGAFFIGESIEFRWKKHNMWVINCLIIMGVLKLAYWGIEVVHHIHYDFGLPAILVSSFVLVFGKLDYQYISQLKKGLLIVLFVTAFQFLDVMPAMRKFPVGRGETSWDIKLAATVLEGEAVLNAMALVGVLLFLLFAMLIFFQLKDENTLRELSILKEQNQAIRTQAQINEMKNRTYQEMQYLVHDLKSPLTAIQTLVGVLKMEFETEDRKNDVEYLGHIETGIERMSRMISEVLYEDQRSVIPTSALVGVALAQCSVEDYAAYLHVDNQIPQALVSANRFLFPRALVNLLQNSAQAIPPGRVPEIWLRVERQGETATGKVVFTVSDNGAGIEQERLHTIWERGTSGRQSSGLGLAFVRNVVTRLGGEARIESVPGQGTSISVILPEAVDGTG